MVLYCSRELFEALDGLEFPADKQTIIDFADSKNVLEAVNIALNELQEGVVYTDVGSVCDNAKIACDHEVSRALEGLEFPADKERIVAHAKEAGVSKLVLFSLENLPDNYHFNSLSEICEND